MHAQAETNASLFQQLNATLVPSHTIVLSHTNAAEGVAVSRQKPDDAYALIVCSCLKEDVNVLYCCARGTEIGRGTGFPSRAV